MIALMGCGSDHHTDAHPPATYFVTGTYATYESSRFCTTWDTLYVNQDNDQKTLYWIDRRTVYQRNCGDQYFPVEFSLSDWKGVLPPGDTNLTGLDQGPGIRFFPQKNTLQLDYTLYTRVQ